MEKLIELLNEYEGISMRKYKHEDLCYFYKDRTFLFGKPAELQVISKNFGFIEWLYDNNKINTVGFVSWFDDENVENIIKYLAISDEPIELLISLLK